MTSFYFIAGGMLLLALFVLLRALRGDPAAIDQRSDRTELNIAIARERIAELKARGQTIDEDIRADIERTLAQELADQGEPGSADTGRGAFIVGAALLLLALPLGSWWLYNLIGNSEVLQNPALLRQARAPSNSAGAASQMAAPSQNAPSIDELLPQLEQKLEDNPDDAFGWRLLGNTYLKLGRFDEAEQATTRSIELNPSDPAVLSQLAEIKGMQAAGSLVGEPTELLQRALEADPAHGRSRFLLAIAWQQQDEHEQALQLFNSLIEEAENDPQLAPALEGLRQMSDDSRQALGMGPSDGSRNTTPSDVESAVQTTESPAVGNAGVSLAIRLSDEARSELSDDLSLFVYARAQNGPPMPLAAQRGTVADLPLEIRLDESMAMMPQMSLASFDTVVVGARVSPSGNAIAESGDWFGEVENVTVGEESVINVVIDRRKP